MKDLLVPITKEEKDALIARYRKKKHLLLAVSVVFTLSFVLVAKYADFIDYAVVQGMFLGIGFIFVSWISEVEKKLKKLRHS